MHRVYSPKIFVTADIGVSGMRQMPCRVFFFWWEGESAAYYECCFTTTFDTIPRLESTTAAQVSSAEDSKASTV
jgi:hypothetical protein